MFTIDHIEKAHQKVKSGTDFPGYIREIKDMGVIHFETWVIDSHTVYFGENGFKAKSGSMYKPLILSTDIDKDKFARYLKIHQQGQTDYVTFCKDCAESGIEKWIVSLNDMTCTYYDTSGNNVLVEKIPSA